MKLPGFWRVVKSFSEPRGGGQLCLGKRCPETPDQRVFTYFSGCRVPEVSDTKKYQDKGEEQQAEEQSAQLVPGAALLPRLGCFCLSEGKRRWPGCAEGPSRRGRHTSDRAGPAGTGGQASPELTSRKRQRSGLRPAVPPMVCALRVRAASPPEEESRSSGCPRGEGRATATPAEGQPAVPSAAGPAVRWLSHGRGLAAL